MAKHSGSKQNVLAVYSLLGIMIFLLPGCAAYILGGERQSSSRSDHSYNRADNQIRYRVNKAMVNDPGIKATDIRVRVREGIVHLYGRVDSRRVRERILNLVSTVAGVEKVVSHLRVRRR